MKRIADKPRLQVTFSKRRQGLFKKAAELSLLCGVDIAILVESPAGKIYTFSNTPTADVLVRRFLSGGSRSLNAVPEMSRTVYAQTVERLETEKRKKNSGNSERFLWDQEIEGMELGQLEEFAQELEGMRNWVSAKAVEMEKQTSACSSAAMIVPVTTYDFDMGVDSFGVEFDLETDAYHCPTLPQDFDFDWLDAEYPPLEMANIDSSPDIFSEDFDFDLHDGL